VLEDGRISPLPSISMIRKAIHAAKENLKRNRKDGWSGG
jgi:hypothetical protein